MGTLARYATQRSPVRSPRLNMKMGREDIYSLFISIAVRPHSRCLYQRCIRHASTANSPLPPKQNPGPKKPSIPLHVGLDRNPDALSAISRIPILEVNEGKILFRQSSHGPSALNILLSQAKTALSTAAPCVNGKTNSQATRRPSSGGVSTSAPSFGLTSRNGAVQNTTKAKASCQTNDSSDATKHFTFPTYGARHLRKKAMVPPVDETSHPRSQAKSHS